MGWEDKIKDKKTLVNEFHQLRYDDEDFANQYDADEFEEWLKDNELIEIN